MKKYLITAAFPYANGDLHIGHLLEYIQADIWVRFKKFIGDHCTFICSIDAHGTPIMLKSIKEKTTPEKLVNFFYKRQKYDLEKFLVDFDNFYTTHSSENFYLTKKFYNILRKKKLIEKKVVLQFFDKKNNIFLPDRYIKGTCPNCLSNNQYGDHCEKCGKNYNISDILFPISILSNEKPIKKKTTDYFYKIHSIEKKIKYFINTCNIQESVKNKLLEWINNKELKNWCISRDVPYFGIKIPYLKKYFYVWFDAPIGYIANLKNLHEKKKNTKFKNYWNKKYSDIEIHHFIGKDIIYFHGLFWPAILIELNLKTPSRIHTHGFITYNNEKISKSKNQAISAREFIKKYSPEYLRYYYASRINNNINDINFSTKDFIKNINYEFIGKIINIFSRIVNIINKHFKNYISKKYEDTILKRIFSCKENIILWYNNCQYSKITKKVLELSAIINYYISSNKPWEKIKNNKILAQIVCNTSLNAFKIIITYLYPIIPNIIKKIEKIINYKISWNNINNIIINHKINKFEKIVEKIPDEK